jgi:hypothetical protein
MIEGRQHTAKKSLYLMPIIITSIFEENHGELTSILLIRKFISTTKIISIGWLLKIK